MTNCVQHAREIGACRACLTIPKLSNRPLMPWCVRPPALGRGADAVKAKGSKCYPWGLAARAPCPAPHLVPAVPFTAL